MQLVSSMTGSDFLFLYGMLLGVCAAAAWTIPHFGRTAGRLGKLSDVESIALLAGGSSRMAEAVMADLYVRGGLEAVAGTRLAIANRGLSATTAGKAVLALEGAVNTRTVRDAIAIYAERLIARLRRGGLLMWPDHYLRLRWLSVLPLVCLLLFGLARLRLVIAADLSSGPLSLLLGMTAVLAIARFIWSDPRTKAGLALVEELRAARGRSIGGAGGEDAALAVALYGSAVLVGTPWEALHALRQPSDASGSNADGSSGEWGGGGCDAGDGGGCGD